MKAYLNTIDKKLAEEQVGEILKLEQLVDGKSRVYVNSELIQEELRYLLGIDKIIDFQKELVSARKKKGIFNARGLKKILDGEKNRLRKLHNVLEKYRKFLKIVHIAQLDKEMAFKGLDKNEFHPILDTDMDIHILVDDWKWTNNIKGSNRSKFYSESLVKLRNAMYELDN